MTFSMFKKLLQGLLTGDNVIPDDDGVLGGLMGYALQQVATQADSLHLMTLSTTANVLRLAHGDYLIRMPVEPTSITTAVDALVGGETSEEIEAAQAADLAATDNQLLDIDEELVSAVARYVASMLSRDKGGIHVKAADRIIKDYNAKTWEILEQMLLEAYELGLETSDPSYQTLWNP